MQSSMRLIGSSCLAVLLIAFSSAAQQPQLVKNFNPAARKYRVRHQLLVEDKLFFLAEDEQHGEELWVSDGSATGTYMVQDLEPGGGTPRIRDMIAFRGALIFTAEVSGRGREFYRASATPNSIVLLKGTEINPSGSAVSNDPFYFISPDQTKLFFSANDGTNGYELWRTDGTAAGTMLAHNYPSTGPMGSEARVFGAIGSSLIVVTRDFHFDFFVANSIGLPIAPPFASMADVVDDHGTFYHGRLYFVGTDLGYTTSREIFSVSTTSIDLLKDINPGSAPCDAREFVFLAGKLYFAAVDDAGRLNSELWETDGSAAGTRKVLGQDINPDPNQGSHPANLFVSDGKLFFSAIATADMGEELLVYTPGAAAIERFDLQPGPAGSTPEGFVEHGGNVYFIATDDLNGLELRRYEPVSGAVALEEDLSSGAASSFRQPFYLHARTGDILFFGGVDPYGLHRTTGAGANAELVYPLEFENQEEGSSFGVVIRVGQADYLSVFANQGVDGMYRTDGTEAGTQLVVPFFSPMTAVENPAVPGESLLLGRNAATGIELFKSDGTLQGTSLVRDVVPGSMDSWARELVVSAGKVYFNPDPSGDSRDANLWLTEGTFSGTKPLTEILRQTYFFSAEHLTPLNDKLVFTAFSDRSSDASSEYNLWVSNGTVSGTKILKNIRLGGDDGLYIQDPLPVLNGIAYFGANDGGSNELWGTDGTVAGTSKRADPDSLSALSPRFITVAGDKLVMSGSIGTVYDEPVISDGTSAGTALLKDIHISGSSQPRDFSYVAPRNLTFFVANDGSHGRELWRTDGKPDGTSMVKDITPGTDSTGLDDLTPVNEFLYFLVKDGVGASVLWRSDGSADGTQPVDFGLSFSTPPVPYVGILGVANGNLYLEAQHAELGIELYRLTDECPQDHAKFSAGQCGCGKIETDSDADGTADCVDECSLDPLKIVAGACGCGVSDQDLNGNGIADCLINAELVWLYTNLEEAVGGLKPVRITGKRKKDKLSRKTFKALKLEIKGVLAAIDAFIAQHAALVTLFSGNEIKKETIPVKKAVKKALRVKSKRFKRSRKQATKLISKLVQQLA